MSAIAVLSKATVTALTPFAAVYFWPKEPQVFYYIPKNAAVPLLSLPRPGVALSNLQAAQDQRQALLL